MKKGEIVTADAKIKRILAEARTVAVLGISPKPDRDSHRVGKFLKEKGYRIVPVRPGLKEILGERAYGSLDEIQKPVDVVDVFRSPDKMVDHAHEAIRLKPKVFWMQLGIENQEAAALLVEAGIDVVMNRCMKVEHERFFKSGGVPEKTPESR